MQDKQITKYLQQDNGKYGLLMKLALSENFTYLVTLLWI